LRLLWLRRWELETQAVSACRETRKVPGICSKDLKANAGKSVVIPGEQQTPDVHLAAIAINQALGNVGKTVVYTETINPLPSIQGEDLKSLVADLNAGKVDWLVILNTNPVYSSPADLDFESALNKARRLCTSARMRMRRPRSHTGTSTTSIIWNRGRMRVPMTARSASSSR